jgi:hypothetical protein
MKHRLRSRIYWKSRASLRFGTAGVLDRRSRIARMPEIISGYGFAVGVSCVVRVEARSAATSRSRRLHTHDEDFGMFVADHDRN